VSSQERSAQQYPSWELIENKPAADGNTLGGCPGKVFVGVWARCLSKSRPRQCAAPALVDPVNFSRARRDGQARGQGFDLIDACCRRGDEPPDNISVLQTLEPFGDLV